MADRCPVCKGTGEIEDRDGIARDCENCYGQGYVYDKSDDYGYY